MSENQTTNPPPTGKAESSANNSPGEKTFNPLASPPGDSSSGGVGTGILAAFNKAIQGPSEGSETPKVVPPEPKKDDPPKDAPKPDETPKDTPKDEPKPENLSPEDAELAELEKNLTTENAAKSFSVIKQSRAQAYKQRDLALKDVKDRERQIAELTNKLQEAHSNMEKYVPVEEFDKYKKERDELQEFVSRVAYENSPEFKSKFDVPVENAKGRLKSILDGTGVSEKEVEIVSLLPDGEDKQKRLDAIFDNLPPSRQALLGSAINSFIEKLSTRQTELENHKQKNAEYQREYAEKTKQNEQRLAKTFDDVTDRIQANVAFLNKIEGNDEHNKAVDHIMSTAKMIWESKVEPEKIIEAAYAAAVSPFLEQRCKQLDEDNKKLREEIEGIKGASARVNADGAGSGPEPEMDITTRFKKAAGIS